jgi:DNA-binding transcriptional ArsR family regulator
MDDLLSETFSALADPTRRGIIVRLSRGEATVSELAEPFDHRRGPAALPELRSALGKAVQPGAEQRKRDQWRQKRGRDADAFCPSLGVPLLGTRKAEPVVAPNF